MSKHSEPYEDVKVRFYGCKYGYIKFDLTVGSQAVTVRMTDCWDPVPDLFRWMEAILTNVMECSFFIDEEQTDKGFVAKRMGQERVLLIVNDREDKIFIESVVHRKQMV
ncbi:MAG: hypothetical protein GY710_13170, partial [Desulfobacteraceae bacterium]|nr:hypothetical protein [Desulfobacteraceae bacterium]